VNSQTDSSALFPNTTNFMTRDFSVAKMIIYLVSRCLPLHFLIPKICMHN
jgi:hypothetical protein